MGGYLRLIQRGTSQDLAAAEITLLFSRMVLMGESAFVELELPAIHTHPVVHGTRK
jgi:hypothetical protein